MKTTLLKRLLSAVALFSLMLMSAPSWAQVSCYQIVGYFPSWSGSPSDLDYSKYTHINYSFGIPNANGSVSSIDNSGKLVDLVNQAHANNTQVLLAIGGWLSSSPSNTPFENIASNASSINNFVNTCQNLVNQYNLDGIDIDWEYPTTQTRWNNLMRPLATRLHSMGKIVTAAVAGGQYYGQGYGDLSMLDLVNIMAYDCNCPTNSPYSSAVESLNYWTSRGVPQEKRMLGVPFYSSDNTTAIHVQKANLAKASAGGIMIWEISAYGDINAIYNTLGNVCSGGDTPPSNTYAAIPGTVCASSYAEMSGVQKESTNDGSCGQSVGYIDAGDWMTFPVDVAVAGTYTVNYRVASEAGGGSIRLEQAGGSGSVYGTLDVPTTGGWQNWTTISNEIDLPAGKQKIGLAVPSGGFNLNYIEFENAAGSAYIQAEDYAFMSGIQLENTTDDGGGQNVGYTDAGDWMSYDPVNIPASGVYTIAYRVASQEGGGVIQLEQAGGTGTVYGTVNVPATGGWQNWTTIYQQVNLTAGNRSFGIKVVAGGFNINWFSVTPASGAARMSAQTIAVEEAVAKPYPNPFTNEVIIPVALSDMKGDFKLSIYNASGKEIKTFGKESLKSEEARVTWDGTDHRGANLANGVYYYKLITPNGSVSGKLLKAQY